MKREGASPRHTSLQELTYMYMYTAICPTYELDREMESPCLTDTELDNKVFVFSKQLRKRIQLL